MPEFPSQVMEVVRDTFEARWWRRLLITLLLVTSVIVPRIFGFEAVVTIAFLVLTAILYLEALETVALRIDDNLSYPSVIPSHGEATDRLETRMEEVNPNRIHLLDYSTRFANTVLEKAADHDVNDIYLLMKVPQTAINRSQYDGQILPALKTHLRTFVQDNPHVDLHVRLYSQDGAVRGRRIGGKYLLLSWYSRDFHREEEADLPGSETVFDWVRNRTVREEQSLHGHNNPMIEISREDPEFESADEDFFQSLYRNLWETGITPKELYECEREHYEPGSYTQPGEFGLELPVADWVIDETGSVDGSKVGYLDDISDEETGAGQLFT